MDGSIAAFFEGRLPLGLLAYWCKKCFVKSWSGCVATPLNGFLNVYKHFTLTYSIIPYVSQYTIIFFSLNNFIWGFCLMAALELPFLPSFVHHIKQFAKEVCFAHGIKACLDVANYNVPTLWLESTFKTASNLFLQQQIQFSCFKYFLNFFTMLSSSIRVSVLNIFIMNALYLVLQQNIGWQTTILLEHVCSYAIQILECKSCWSRL